MTEAYCTALRAGVSIWTLDQFYYAGYEEEGGELVGTGCKGCTRCKECFAPVTFEADVLIQTEILGKRREIGYFPNNTVENFFNPKPTITKQKDPVWVLSLSSPEADAAYPDYYPFTIKARDDTGVVMNYPAGVGTLPDSMCSPLDVTLPLVCNNLPCNKKKERRIAFDLILGRVASALAKRWAAYGGSSFNGFRKIFSLEDLWRILMVECPHPAHASERYTIITDINAFEKEQIEILAPPEGESRGVVKGVAEEDGEPSSKKGSVQEERGRRFDTALVQLIEKKEVCYKELAVWLGMSDKREIDLLRQWLRRYVINSDTCEKSTHYSEQESQTRCTFNDGNGEKQQSKAMHRFTAEGVRMIKERYVNYTGGFSADKPS